MSELHIPRLCTPYFFCLAAQPRLRDGGIHSSSVVTELGRRIFPKLREFRPLTSLYVGRGSRNLGAYLEPVFVHEAVI